MSGKETRKKTILMGEPITKEVHSIRLASDLPQPPKRSGPRHRVNRGNLYEALSEDGNPTLATLLEVTRALGLRLRLELLGYRLTQDLQPSERRNLLDL